MKTEIGEMEIETTSTHEVEDGNAISENLLWRVVDKRMASGKNATLSSVLYTLKRSVSACSVHHEQPTVHVNRQNEIVPYCRACIIPVTSRRELCGARPSRVRVA